MTRGRLLATAVAVAIVTGVWMLLPRRSIQLQLAADPHVARGAVHVHTTRSDGAGTPEDVARAASRAGLEFVILTDHGDGLRLPDPPRYVDGVLVIDAVEISTADGHYVALGLGQAPYRLAGDARDVIEDVHRLGGFGFAAHPDSPKPELRWREWTVPLDGLEWLNADSEWRDETRTTLARTFLAYWFRGPESIVSMFSRPSILERWDRLTTTSRVVAIAGTDAHARLPLEPGAEPGEGPSLHVPSYESSFRAMAIRVPLPSPLGRTNASAPADAKAILDNLRAGHAYTVIDALAGPAALDFFAVTSSARFVMGDDVVAESDVTLTAELQPPLEGASLVMIKNGTDATRAVGSRLRFVHAASEPAATYRIEVRLDSAPGTPPIPWIVSNPIYVLRSARSVRQVASPYESVRVLTDGQGTRPWTIEKHPASDARIGQGRAPDGTAATHFSWRLASGVPSGQYAALALPVSGADFADSNAVAVTLQAPRPMRVSVQLRVPDGKGLRWQRSVYLDSTPRTVVVPFSEMRAIEAGPDSRVDINRADTLLLVVDTVNTVPGSAGECWVGPVRVVRTAAAGPSAMSAR
jgi:hypothetical protein